MPVHRTLDSKIRERRGHLSVDRAELRARARAPAADCGIDDGVRQRIEGPRRARGRLVEAEHTALVPVRGCSGD